MAQETLTVQVAGRSGAQVNLQSFTSLNGFKFLNDGRTVLYVENDAGDLTFGFTIQTTVDGQSGLSRTVVVTASQKWVIGPFPVDQYNDADGYCVVTADADLATATAAISVG